MNLRDKLKEDTILVPMQAVTREDAIQELLLHLQELEIISATVKLFSDIKDQEESFTSAAGRGIAYPHSTSIEVDKFTCVLGLSKPGIDFDSPDSQLCHLILLTLSPQDDPSDHRKFITRFRTMLDNPEIRSQLLDASEIEEVMNIIMKWEDDEAHNNELD